MNTITLNDETLQAEEGWKTWGELLEVLDRRCADAGQVVTAARFDGVDQPTFRGDGARGHLLKSLSVIEVESTPPGALLLSTLDQAKQAVVALGASAERLGGAFRGFDVSSANEELVEFAQSLGTVVTLASVLSQAIGVDLATVRCDGASGVDMIGELTTHADALIGAQDIGDWITVADVVEYDVAPALGRWPALFDALRASLGKAGVPVACP